MFSRQITDIARLVFENSPLDSHLKFLKRFGVFFVSLYEPFHIVLHLYKMLYQCDTMIKFELIPQTLKAGRFVDFVGVGL